MGRLLSLYAPTLQLAKEMVYSYEPCEIMYFSGNDFWVTLNSNEFKDTNEKERRVENNHELVA